MRYLDASEVSQCTTCGAQIIWTRTQAGKRMPLDAKASADGNLVLTNTNELLPTVRTVGSVGHKPGQLLYRNHAFTCKQAMAHREKTPKKRLPPPGPVLFEGGDGFP
jgi:hypothetical protein